MPRRADSEQFLKQETLRFSDEERERLNAIMERVKTGAKGHIYKADILKSLMGFPLDLTDENDRQLLATGLVHGPHGKGKPFLGRDKAKKDA